MFKSFQRFKTFKSFGRSKTNKVNIQRLFHFLFLWFYCWVVPSGVSAQTTVRIAFNGFGGVAPLYLGQETGIFKKQGLNLELIFIPGGSLSLQALIGKSLDLLMTGGPPVVNAYFAGSQDQDHRWRDQPPALYVRCNLRYPKRRARQRKEDRHQSLWQQHRLCCSTGAKPFFPNAQRCADHPSGRLASSSGGPAIRGDSGHGFKPRGSPGGTETGFWRAA